MGRSFGVHALVDGHDALLEVDTGSFELRLAPEFVSKYGIDPARVFLKLGDVRELTLRPLVEELEGPDQTPFGTGFKAHEDGIIGLDVLRRFALGLDLVDNKVAFWTDGRLGADTARSWTKGSDPGFATMTLSNSGRDDWFRLQVIVNGRPINALLDTGTAYSTVNPSLLTPLKLNVVGTTPVQEIGRLEDLKVATADSITFGSLSAEFPVLNVENDEDHDVDGILGTEALGSGRFIIDMPGLTFYGERAPAARQNPLERRLRTLGIDTFPSGPKRILVLVKPQSDAEKQGVKSGDRLVSVGGLTVEDMFQAMRESAKPEQARKLLDLALKAGNGDISIVVQKREGSSVTLALPK